MPVNGEFEPHCTSIYMLLFLPWARNFTLSTVCFQERIQAWFHNRSQNRLRTLCQIVIYVKQVPSFKYSQTIATSIYFEFNCFRPIDKRSSYLTGLNSMWSKLRIVSVIVQRKHVISPHMLNPLWWATTSFYTPPWRVWYMNCQQSKHDKEHFKVTNHGGSRFKEGWLFSRS